MDSELTADTVAPCGVPSAAKVVTIDTAEGRFAIADLKTSSVGASV
jgi:hypothetical protein